MTLAAEVGLATIDTEAVDESDFLCAFRIMVLPPGGPLGDWNPGP